MVIQKQSKFIGKRFILPKESHSQVSALQMKTINGCNSGEAYLNVSAEGAKYALRINLSGKRTEIKYLFYYM